MHAPLYSANITITQKTSEAKPCFGAATGSVNYDGTNYTNRTIMSKCC